MIGSISPPPFNYGIKVLLSGITIGKVVKWKLVYWFLSSQTKLFTSWWRFCYCLQISSWLLKVSGVFPHMQLMQDLHCWSAALWRGAGKGLEPIYTRLFGNGIEILLNDEGCSFRFFKYSMMFLCSPVAFFPLPFRVFFPMNCADASQLVVGLSFNWDRKAVDKQEQQPLL